MKYPIILKKALKLLGIPFLIVLVIFIYISSIINNNQKYLNSITKNIKDNYKINEEITYYNEYNNYYIFTTENKVIVLNKEYSEILNENISIIKKTPNNQELIYKTNKLMFEETILKDTKLIYKYYDATTGEFIKETVMEMQ